MVRCKFPILLILGIFLISCAPSKKMLTYKDSKIYFEKIKARDNFVKSLTATGNITVDSPEFSNSAKLKVNLRRPDTLMLKIETIFGIDLGEVQIYADNFKLIDRFNDRVLQGKVSEYLQKYLGIDLTIDELVDILIACPRVGEVESQSFEDYEFLVFEKKEGRDVILKFNSDLELESYAFFKSGVKVFEVIYLKYAKVKDITFPRVVRIYDGSGRGIYLNFSEININS